MIKHFRKYLHNIRLRVSDWERDRVNAGAEAAKAIRREIEHISEFKLNPVGTSPEEGFVKGLKPDSKHLDYEVLYNNKKIAEIDMTYSNYTFKDSREMPVRDYKGIKVLTLGVPTFFVYHMVKEPVHLKNGCVWITGANVVKCKLEYDFWGGKTQRNFKTNKNDWNRGLDTLITQFRELSGNKNAQSNQTTLS